VTPAVVAAERAQAVRIAGQVWHAEGVIDDAGLASLNAAYPDDRRRVGPAFRVLLAFFTLLAGGAALGLGVLTVSSPVVAWFFLAVFAAFTEVQIGPLRCAGHGSEEATAVLTWITGMIVAGWSLDKWTELGGSTVATAVMLTGAALGAAVLWRWGVPALGAASALSGLLWLGRVGGGRLAVIAGATLIVVAAVIADRSARLAVSHRSAWEAALAAALLGLYATTNLVSWDGRWLEEVLSGRTVDPESAAFRPLFLLATAIVPLVVLTAGIWLRHRLLLVGGTIMAVLSLATVRRYVNIAPTWLILVIAGGAAILAALALLRFLASGRGGERHGLTAEPIGLDRRHEALVETAAALAAFQPTPREPAAPAQPDFKGGGGQLGGGGASGDF
jgi:uncharacterized membrane protein YgcG